jgi:hypothetical protein
MSEAFEDRPSVGVFMVAGVQSPLGGKLLYPPKNVFVSLSMVDLIG